MLSLRPRIEPHLVLRPCHNDLNPNNLAYDGERVWVLDWDTACMGDPFQDLGSLLFWVFRSPAQQAALLDAYFGGEPSARDRAKLTVVRELSSCFYATVFQLLAASGGALTSPSNEDDFPSVAEAFKALASGALNFGSPEGRWRFAGAVARDSLRAVESPGFEEALAAL
jgi:thiamine kinase-like enzyme